MKKGKFIVIEGGDGSGKSTQIEKLQEYYGDQVVFTREPGGTEYAEAIRDLVLMHPKAENTDGITQFLLMWASRAEHMNNLIIPAIEESKTVISSRFDSSTFAYNLWAHDRPDLTDYFWQTRKVILGENLPDIYIYLDISSKVGLSRINNDNREELDHLEKKGDEFHKKVRDGYVEFHKKVNGRIIDANQSIEEVRDEIISVIESLE